MLARVLFGLGRPYGFRALSGTVNPTAEVITPDLPVTLSAFFDGLGLLPEDTRKHSEQVEKWAKILDSREHGSKKVSTSLYDGSTWYGALDWQLKFLGSTALGLEAATKFRKADKVSSITATGEMHIPAKGELQVFVDSIFKEGEKVVPQTFMDKSFYKGAKVNLSDVLTVIFNKYKIPMMNFQGIFSQTDPRVSAIDEAIRISMCGPSSAGNPAARVSIFPEEVRAYISKSSKGDIDDYLSIFTKAMDTVYLENLIHAEKVIAEPSADFEPDPDTRLWQLEEELRGSARMPFLAGPKIIRGYPMISSKVKTPSKTAIPLKELDPGLREAKLPTKLCYIDKAEGKVSFRGIPMGKLIKDGKDSLDIMHFLMHGKFPTSEGKSTALKRIQNYGAIDISRYKATDKPGYILRDQMVQQTRDSEFDLKNLEDHQKVLEIMMSVVPHVIGLKPGVVPKSVEAKSYEEFVFKLITGRSEMKDHECEALRLLYITQSEHGFSNSVFAATSIASAHPTDMFGIYSAAFTSLCGAKHGGANIQVLEMLENIQKLPGGVKEYLDTHKIIPGIGHAVYKTVPEQRAGYIRAFLQGCLDNGLLDEDTAIRFKIAKEIEAHFVAKSKATGKGLFPNVDLYSGLIMEGVLGIKRELFPMVFFMSLTSSIGAHVKEVIEIKQPLIRPGEDYRGPWVERTSKVAAITTGSPPPSSL